MAWDRVEANPGSGGVDGQSLEAFGQQLGSELNRLQTELQGETYQPQPVRQVQIPKAGKPGEFRTLGIPTIYDRVCSRRCSIGWNRSLSRYSMRLTLDIGEGDRRRMPCAKCGKRSRADGSGWWTRT